MTTRAVHGVSPKLINTCRCAVCEGVRRQVQATPSLDTLKPKRVGVTGIKELAGAIPLYFGFSPTESVCVVGLADGQVSVSARMDIGEVDGQTEQVAAMLHRNGISEVIVLGVSDEERLADSASTQAATILTDNGIGVLHVETVENRDVQTPSAPAFSAAMDMGSVGDYSSKDDLAKSFKPVGSTDFELTTRERDEFMADIEVSNAREEAARWKAIAVQTSSPDAYAVCAWANYMGGNGASAQLAVDEGMALDQKNVMLRILDSSLEAGIPPNQIRSAFLAAMR